MPVAESRRSNPILLWGGLALAIIVVVVVVRSLTRETIGVRYAAVTRQNLISSVSTNGKVEPMDYFQAHAPFPGVIKKVFVQEGQKIQAGAPLIQMDDADARARIASTTSALSGSQLSLQSIQQGGSSEERITMSGELARAQLQQQQATRDLAAIEQLEQKGAASAAEVADARQRLAVANASLQSIQQRTTGRFGDLDRSHAKAQIEDARASLAAARNSYSAANIHSPIAGTVYSVPVSQYDFVPVGDDLVDVADLNRIQVRAYFDEPEIGKLAVGQAVKIVWDARPNMTWHGHIDRAPTTVITYGTRSVGECIITVDDARGDLLPNTNVTVTVTTSQRFNVMSVPREALHTEGGNFVYRIVDGRLARTPVQVGILNLTRVEITGGLGEKDTVALGATSNRDLTNGLQVKTVE